MPTSASPASITLISRPLMFAMPCASALGASARFMALHFVFWMLASDPGSSTDARLAVRKLKQPQRALWAAIARRTEQRRQQTNLGNSIPARLRPSAPVYATLPSEAEAAFGRRVARQYLPTSFTYIGNRSMSASPETPRGSGRHWLRKFRPTGRYGECDLNSGECGRLAGGGPQAPEDALMAGSGWTVSCRRGRSDDRYPIWPCRSPGRAGAASMKD